MLKSTPTCLSLVVILLVLGACATSPPEIAPAPKAEVKAADPGPSFDFVYKKARFHDDQCILASDPAATDNQKATGPAHCEARLKLLTALVDGKHGASKGLDAAQWDFVVASMSDGDYARGAKLAAKMANDADSPYQGHALAVLADIYLSQKKTQQAVDIYQACAAIESPLQGYAKTRVAVFNFCQKSDASGLADIKARFTNADAVHKVQLHHETDAAGMAFSCAHDLQAELLMNVRLPESP